MNKFRAVFAETFGMPLPAAMLPDGTHCVGGERHQCSTRNPKSEPIVDGSGFSRLKAGDYFIGFWDSAAHTYFSYCRADVWRRIAFRKISGGIYDNGEACRQAIREWLTAYCALEEQLRGKVVSLHMVADIDYAWCEVVWGNGKKQKIGIKEPADFRKLLPRRKPVSTKRSATATERPTGDVLELQTWDGETHENPTLKFVLRMVEHVDTESLMPFVVLSRTNGEFVQTLATDGDYRVEWKEIGADGRERHYVADKTDSTRKRKMKIGTGRRQSVSESAILSCAEAQAVFTAFYRGEPRPSKFAWVDITDKL